MGDVVPAWGSGASPVVDDILAAVFSGDTWPEGSETAARVVAQQFQQFYDILADAGTDYVTAAMQVAAGWEGVTGQSFEQFVRQLAGEGMVAAAGNALAYSEQVDNFAVQTEFSKYSINAAFYIAAVAIVAALIAAFFSFGASAAAVGPAAFAARSMVTRILAQLVMSVSRATGARAVGAVATRPVIGHLAAEGIEEAGEEIAIVAYALGKQGRMDWQALLAAGLGGLFGGILGMKVFTPFTEWLGRHIPGLRRLLTAGLDAAGRPTRGIMPAFVRFPGRAFTTGFSNAFSSPIASFFANAIAYGKLSIPTWHDMAMAALGGAGRTNTISPTNVRFLYAATHWRGAMNNLHAANAPNATPEQLNDLNEELRAPDPVPAGEPPPDGGDGGGQAGGGGGGRPAPGRPRAGPARLLRGAHLPPRRPRGDLPHRVGHRRPCGVRGQDLSEISGAPGRKTDMPDVG